MTHILLDIKYNHTEPVLYDKIAENLLLLIGVNLTIIR